MIAKIFLALSLMMTLAAAVDPEDAWNNFMVIISVQISRFYTFDLITIIKCLGSSSNGILIGRRSRATQSQLLLRPRCHRSAQQQTGRNLPTGSQQIFSLGNDNVQWIGLNI